MKKALWIAAGLLVLLVFGWRVLFPPSPEPRRTGPAPVCPPEVLAKLREHLKAGRKIEAIKAYREATDVGLKEAKDAVEALEGRP